MTQLEWDAEAYEDQQCRRCGRVIRTDGFRFLDNDRYANCPPPEGEPTSTGRGGPHVAPIEWYRARQAELLAYSQRREAEKREAKERGEVTS